ncbi:MAG: class I SAM-dependent methyltransferase [Bdellovibrionota bacterium]|nr:MAG: class I SAM-dependent methyltransferase [Bdellovibrionota bacterium]
MYRLWHVVTRPILEAVRPSHIVEIGSEFGFQTELLLNFCRTHGAKLTVIDPLPQFDVSAWRAQNDGVGTLREQLSLDALPHIADFDVILIDGDHNWYTVYNELKLVEARKRTSGRWPLVLFHDAGWPYGRRDMYYNPETIPAEHRHPHERAGIAPGEAGTTEEGINRTIYNASREGGARNGVLTAVEDFMKEHEGSLQLIVVPGLSGVGVLVSDEALRSNTALNAVVDALRLPAKARELVDITELQRWKAEMAATQSTRKLAKREKELEAVQERLTAARADTKRLQVQHSALEKECAQLKRELSHTQAQREQLLELASRLISRRVDQEGEELQNLQQILTAQLVLAEQLLVSRRLKIGQLVLRCSLALVSRVGVDLEAIKLRLLSLQQEALMLSGDVIPRVVKAGEVLKAASPSQESGERYFQWIREVKARLIDMNTRTAAWLGETFSSRDYWLGDLLVRRIGHRVLLRSVDEREWGPRYAAALETRFRQFEGCLLHDAPNPLSEQSGAALKRLSHAAISAICI